MVLNPSSVIQHGVARSILRLTQKLNPRPRSVGRRRQRTPGHIQREKEGKSRGTVQGDDWRHMISRARIVAGAPSLTDLMGGPGTCLFRQLWPSPSSHLGLELTSTGGDDSGAPRRRLTTGLCPPCGRFLPGLTRRVFPGMVMGRTQERSARSVCQLNKGINQTTNARIKAPRPLPWGLGCNAAARRSPIEFLRQAS